MRLQKLDILRWIAILLMVLFHLNYSLVNLFNIDLLNISEYFWFIIWKISVILFIFISWISFFLAEKKYLNKIILKYIKVSFILWVIAWWISLSTLLFFSEQYIRFWIIHFFSVSFLLILFFRKLKYYNLIFWIIIIVYGFYFIPIINSEYYYFLWFTYSWFKSADFYPLLPFFWIMLLWYTFWLFLSDRGLLDIFKTKSTNNIVSNIFEYMWKKSLLIYLLHQPIIILMLYLLKI